MTRDEELLLEQVTAAYRERGADGDIRAHQAWHDLDDAGRLEAFDATVLTRKLERAIDRRTESSTVRAVLARLGSSR